MKCHRRNSKNCHTICNYLYIKRIFANPKFKKDPSSSQEKVKTAIQFVKKNISTINF